MKLRRVLVTDATGIDNVANGWVVALNETEIADMENRLRSHVSMRKNELTSLINETAAERDHLLG